MAVEHDDGMRHENRRHGSAWAGLTRTARKRCQLRRMISAVGAEVFEDSGGKLNHFDCGLGSNTGSLYSGGLRDKMNGVKLADMEVGQTGR